MVRAVERSKPAEWDEYRLTEFFGVLPEKDEDSTRLSFRVERDGMTLAVTFFHYDFDVRLELLREGVDEPVLRVRIVSSSGAKYVAHANGYECLEIGASDRFFHYYGTEWIASMAVRLKVNPHVCVELFRPEAD